MVRGHPSPRFLPSRSLWRLDLGAYGMRLHVIGPSDNGFTGPAVALDGPG